MNPDFYQACLRWAHMSFGVLWFAQAFFTSLIFAYLMPQLDMETRKKVIPLLAPRLGILAAVGALPTLITGFYLMYRIYGTIGFDNTRGAWILVGMTLGILIFLIGFAVLMPTSLKLTKAMKGEIQAPVPELVARMGKFGKILYFLTLPTLFCMTVAAGHPALPFDTVNFVGAMGLALLLAVLLNLFASKIVKS